LSRFVPSVIALLTSCTSRQVSPSGLLIFPLPASIWSSSCWNSVEENRVIMVELLRRLMRRGRVETGEALRKIIAFEALTETMEQRVSRLEADTELFRKRALATIKKEQRH
jgi:hypothetical protein